MAPPFTPVPGTNLLVGNFGAGTNSRIVIIATPDATMHGPWEKIAGSNVIIVGAETREELHRLFVSHSINQIRTMLPGGISGRTAISIRQWLGLFGA
jgi:hypothetical protein